MALLLAAARAGAAVKSAGVSAAAGVTPGGLLFSVSPASRRLRLLAPDGTERAALSLQADEIRVLGVADDGSRVTSPSAGPARFGLEEDSQESSARFVFRDAPGNVLAVRELHFLRGAEPAVLGTDVYFVTRRAGAFVLFRASPAEEATVLLKLSVERILMRTGKAEQVKVHASPAGIVLELRGPYRAIYVDVSRPDVLLSPDPALECGSGSSYAKVFPSRSGGIARIATRTSAARTGGATVLQLERLDDAGRLAGSVELGAAGEIHPLAGGDLLALDGTEAVLLDERGHELSRVPFSSRGDTAPAELAREAAAQRRLAALGEKASGSDWAELAIARGQLSTDRIDLARRDPAGVLARLVRVSDGAADVPRARRVLSQFLAYRAFAGFPTLEHGVSTSRGDRAKSAAEAQAAWAEVLRGGDALVAAGAPRWFQRVLALSLLEERGRESPSWTFAALADAVASGELERRLPEDVFSAELAETTSAIDRDRIARFERGGVERPARAFPPGLPDGFSLDSSGNESGVPGYHIPPGRFASLLLSCLSESGPLGVRSVIEALMEPALATRSLEESGLDFEEDDEMPPSAPERKKSDKPEEAVGRIASLLLEARSSGDSVVSAGAQLLSPYYGLPLDAARWRADVLAKAGLESLAATSLLADRSLPSAAWTSLFGDTLLSARKASANPLRCLEAPFGASGETPDPYCMLLFSTLMYGGDPLADSDGTPAGRSREVAAYTRSPAAPPEVRLHAKLGRVFSGTATAADILEMWRARDLPLSVRQMAVGSSRQQNPLAELAPEWRRELQEGGLTAAEEVVILDALKELDKAEAARVAAERWESGKVPLGEENARAARAFTAALDRETVLARPRLRAALKRALDDEGAGPEAAALLARTGELAALPRLVSAIKTGCLG